MDWTYLDINWVLIDPINLLYNQWASGMILVSFLVWSLRNESWLGTKSFEVNLKKPVLYLADERPSEEIGKRDYSRYTEDFHMQRPRTVL